MMANPEQGSFGNRPGTRRPGRSLEAAAVAGMAYSVMLVIFLVSMVILLTGSGRSHGSDQDSDVGRSTL